MYLQYLNKIVLSIILTLCKPVNLVKTDCKL